MYEMRGPGLWILLVAAAAGACVTAAVAPSRCATCHPAITRGYVESGMGRAFAAASPANVALGEYFHELSQTYYKILARGHEFFERRWQRGGR